MRSYVDQTAVRTVQTVEAIRSVHERHLMRVKVKGRYGAIQAISAELQTRQSWWRAATRADIVSSVRRRRLQLTPDLTRGVAGGRIATTSENVEL